MKEACLNSAREIEAGILPYVTSAACLAVVLVTNLVFQLPS
jgi:hypothetical protein